jgi:hypothetical protein
MPIGTLTPGQPTTVTPDPNPSYYTSFQGPAPDDDIVADDLLEVIQLALNIQRMSVGNIGSPASVMQALTNVSVADWFFVLNEGLFVYTATTQTDNPPWWYSAPGMSNVGSWVNVYWFSLMGSSDPVKLIDSVLPYWQTIQSFHASSPESINCSLVNQGSYWIQIYDTYPIPISTVLSGVLEADKVKLNVTPLQVLASVGDTVVLRIRLTQNGINYYWTLPPMTLPNNEACWPQLIYDSNSDESITIALEGTNENAHTSVVKSPDVQWGPQSAHIWLTVELTRKF